MSYYKKVTLKDIANDSGVSVSSVSMILNKREGVSFSNETVEKVLSSAKKLGYEISSSPKKNGAPAYNTQRSAGVPFFFGEEEWYTCLQYSKIRKIYCYFLP